MKTLNIAICAATLLFGAGASSARAADVARVTVPFSFVANGHRMAPGRYEMHRDQSDPSVVMLDGIDGTKGHVVFETIPDPNSSPDDTKAALTFTRHGDMYRLATIRDGDYIRDLVAR